MIQELNKHDKKIGIKMTQENDYTDSKRVDRLVSKFISPEEAIIKAVPNPHPGILYLVQFNCPNFTSICSITGQPDFANLIIDYVPNNYLVESKSLKLYLTSFRNYNTLYENCTIKIALRLIKELDPIWLKISGYWCPNDEMPINIFYQSGAMPAGLPEQNTTNCKNRG